MLLTFSMGCSTYLSLNMAGEKMIISFTGAACLLRDTSSYKVQGQGQKNSIAGSQLMAGGLGKALLRPLESRYCREVESS